MAILPIIEKKFYPPIPVYSEPPASGEIVGYEYYADIYINLVNQHGEHVNGNYTTINVQEYFNGVAGGTTLVTIPGQSFLFRQTVLMQYATTSGEPYSYDIQIAGVAIDPVGGGYIPPGYSNVAIDTVEVISKETSTGASDAIIRVHATSSYQPLSYSIDGTSWQDSETFSGLTGGGYILWVKDAGGYTASRSANVETISNLLIKDPSVNIGSGNISRWNAAFNPIIFTYQRKDFGVTNIADISGNTSITVNGILDKLKPKDWVYLRAGAYNGTYEVDQVFSSSNFSIKSAFRPGNNHTGFVNINTQRPYYEVRTRIAYEDTLTNDTKSITCIHRPDLTGLVHADLSSFLQSLLQAKDESDHIQLNYRDPNLSASYQVSYAEVWDGHHETFLSLPEPFYVTYAAQQLGDAFGGNMAAYIPFKFVDSPGKRASWITDFAEPAYSNGYPFDIGFLYSEDLAGLDIYYELTLLDINRQPLSNGVQTAYLLNEDGSFLQNQDGSRLVISRHLISSGAMSGPVAEHIGLNRLRINNTFAEEVRYFSLALKYNVGQTVHTVTQTQIVRIDDAVDDASVYLRWIGLKGSWNYYRFVYNQEISLDVQNAVIIKKYIHDWASQDSAEEVISKSAGIKMKVMAEDLSVADIKGLQSIKYSPKVQMLVSRNPIKWQTVIVNTATYAEYETRNGQAPFSITFSMPGVNVQTQ